MSHFLFLKEKHFVWLEALTILLKNTINIYLINLIITLYHIFSLNIYEYQ